MKTTAEKKIDKGAVDQKAVDQKLANLYKAYKGAPILQQAAAKKLLATACQEAGVDLVEYLRAMAPESMAVAHKEAKVSHKGFGAPQANSRRGFIMRCLFENIWSAADIADGIHAMVPGYAEGEVRLYRGKEVVVTRKKNIAAVAGTLQNVRDDNHNVRVCPDGRICIRRKRS
jgi:hypothetical protein